MSKPKPSAARRQAAVMRVMLCPKLVRDDADAVLRYITRELAKAERRGAERERRRAKRGAR